MYCAEVLKTTLALLAFVSGAHGSSATIDGHLSFLQQHATMSTILNRSTGGCATDDDCVGSSVWRCCPSQGSGSPCKDTSGKEKKCKCASQCSKHNTICKSLPTAKSSKKKVLFIGDSISIGYKEPVAALLGDSYEIVHAHGVANSNYFAHCVNTWDVTNSEWDLIAFNMGLHDTNDNVEYVGATNYKKNLQTVVRELKKTGAHLLWLTTTPVSGVCEEGRDDSLVKKYNSVAATLLSDGIGKCDLHNEVLKKCGHNYGSKEGGECSISPCTKRGSCSRTDCTSPHFNDAGYQLLAKTITDCIKSKLH